MCIFMYLIHPTTYLVSLLFFCYSFLVSSVLHMRGSTTPLLLAARAVPHATLYHSSYTQPLTVAEGVIQLRSYNRESDVCLRV
jgi:hypothetical protein